MNIYQIIKTEWLTLFRSRTMSWLLFLLLILSAITIWQAARQYKAAEEGRATAKKYMRDRFTAQGAVNPHSAAHYGHFVYKPMNVLGVLDEGINPFTGVSLQLEGHRQNDVLFSSSQSASSLIRFGQLRLNIMLQLLIPLFILFACHNAITKERENGTLKLLLSQGLSLRHLIWGKTLAYVIVFWAILSVNMLIMWRVTATAADPIPSGRIPAFWLLYGIYYLIVTALSIYVSARSRRSSNALLSLLGVWIISSILLPKATANIGENITPMITKLEMDRRISEDNKKGINGHDPRSERVQRFKDSVLQKYGVDSVSQLPVNVDGLTMQADEEYHNTVYDRHFGDVERTVRSQNSVTAISSFINPFAALKDISMGLAGTDVYHHFGFTRQAEHYRRFLIKTMNDEMAYGGSKTGDWDWSVQPEYWKKINDFQYKQPSTGDAISNYKVQLAALLFWLIASILLIQFTVNRITIV